MTEQEASATLDTFRVARSPGNLLRRNHQRSYEIFSEIVGNDVTRQQVALLISLHQKPGSSQNALVEATGIDKSTLKEMISRLCKVGWVRRQRAANDARAWCLQLTEEGSAFIRQRFDRIVAAQSKILEPLTPEQRADFLTCLRILIGSDR